LGNFNETHKRIRELAEPFLQTRDNDLHTTIATELALELVEEEDGDKDVVIPAIILHDAGWIHVPEEEQVKAYGPNANAPEITRLHEKEGAKIAKDILEKVGYEEQKIREIVQIIDGHDSRTEALSLNDQIVKDADKLTRYDKAMLNAWDSRLRLEDREAAHEGLVKGIEEWFFTKKAKAIARQNIREILDEGDG
jgi:HD superfamily phosphodiesterase